MNTKPLSIRSILLLTISILTTLIASLAIKETYIEGTRMLRIQSLKQASLISDKLFEITEKSAIVRDITSLMLYASDKETIERLKPQLIKSRLEADEILMSVIGSLQEYDYPEFSKKIADTKAEFTKLKDARSNIDKKIGLPMDTQKRKVAEIWFKEATEIILETQGLWMEFIIHFSDINPAVTSHMHFKNFLAVIMEYTGRERSIIGRLIVQNASPTAEEQANLLKWRGAVEMGWSRIDYLANQSGLNPVIEPYIKDTKSHYSTVYDMVRDMFYIPGVIHTGIYPINVDLWLEVSSQTNDSLYELKNAALKETRNYVKMLEDKAKNIIILNVILLVISIMVCFYSFWIIIFRVITPINHMIEALVNATLGNPVSLEPLNKNRRDEIGKLTRVLYIFQQNVEEIKRASGKLKTYTLALERSNKELDDFAYIASHDLKEPLRGIHNHSRFLLEDNAAKLDEESATRLGRLVYLSKRMERLVNDLLYFSRLGRQDMAIVSSDINEVIKDIENTLDVFLHEHNAHITIPTSLPTITCDETRITEVFRNLIINAIKYNDKPTKNVEIGFLHKYHAPNGEISKNVFYVKDDGNGIPVEFYNEIFRIFKRLQVTKDKEEPSTGVGLTFVKKIIERHGGKIWLESEINKGTTFYFTLEGENNVKTNHT